jgi:hypothetical protein
VGHLKQLWGKLSKIGREKAYTPDFQNCVLTHFIFDKRQWDKENNTAKYQAFLPPNKYPEELSVYEIKDLHPEAVWNLAQHVRIDKPVLARADLAWPLTGHKETQLLNRLKLEHDGIPHERHCNITGFPGEKAENTLVAIELAKLATLIKKSENLSS